MLFRSNERITAVEDGGLEAVLDGTIARWFTEPMIEREPERVAAVRAMVAATPIPGYLACCRALKTLDYAKRVGEITLPALFIAGTHDVGTPAAAMREMHASVSGSRYVELDAAHVSNLERPAEFNQALAGFLDSLT